MDDPSQPAKNVDNNDNNNNNSEANEEKNKQDQINQDDGHVNDPQPSTSRLEEDNQINDLQPSDKPPDDNSSRLIVTLNPECWKTSNAFFNYVADFKTSYQNNCKNLKHVEIIQLASKHWRNMSDEEKHPYLVGANIVKKQTMLKPQSQNSAKIKVQDDDDNNNNNKRKRKRQTMSKSQTTKKKQPIRNTKTIVKAISHISDDSDESDPATSDSDDSDNDNDNDSIDSDM